MIIKSLPSNLVKILFSAEDRFQPTADEPDLDGAAGVLDRHPGGCAGLSSGRLEHGGHAL